MAESKDNIPNENLGRNKKAFHNFSVSESLEVGIQLQGTEVKSLKAHHFNFVDSWVEIRNGQFWLKGFQITPYTHGNIYNHDPVRDRRLLAHAKEIEKWRRKVDERGFTIVPLSVYSKHGLIKLEIGLCKGKQSHDKRDDIKDRDMARDADREARDRF
jgi:SsrA-binding protein